jgi:hypothetical protein
MLGTTVDRSLPFPWEKGGTKKELCEDERNQQNDDGSFFH